MMKNGNNLLRNLENWQIDISKLRMDIQNSQVKMVAKSSKNKFSNKVNLEIGYLKQYDL
jgi:hypothetical protein